MQNSPFQGGVRVNDRQQRGIEQIRAKQKVALEEEPAVINQPRPKTPPGRKLDFKTNTPRHILPPLTGNAPRPTKAELGADKPRPFPTNIATPEASSQKVPAAIPKLNLRQLNANAPKQYEHLMAMEAEQHPDREDPESKFHSAPRAIQVGPIYSVREKSRRDYLQFLSPEKSGAKRLDALTTRLRSTQYGLSDSKRGRVKDEPSALTARGRLETGPTVEDGVADVDHTAPGVGSLPLPLGSSDRLRDAVDASKAPSVPDMASAAALTVSVLQVKQKMEEGVNQKHMPLKIIEEEVELPEDVVIMRSDVSVGAVGRIGPPHHLPLDLFESVGIATGADEEDDAGPDTHALPRRMTAGVSATNGAPDGDGQKGMGLQLRSLTKAQCQSVVDQLAIDPQRALLAPHMPDIEQAGAYAVSKYFKPDGSFEWRKCQVTGYDESRGQFRIAWDGDASREKHVARLNLRFAAEDPESFKTRVAQAERLRAEAERQLRLSFFLDDQPDDENLALPAPVLRKILGMSLPPSVVRALSTMAQTEAESGTAAGSPMVVASDGVVIEGEGEDTVVLIPEGDQSASTPREHTKRMKPRGGVNLSLSVEVPPTERAGVVIPLTGQPSASSLLQPSAAKGDGSPLSPSNVPITPRPNFSSSVAPPPIAIPQISLSQQKAHPSFGYALAAWYPEAPIPATPLIDEVRQHYMHTQKLAVLRHQAHEAGKAYKEEREDVTQDIEPPPPADENVDDAKEKEKALMIAGLRLRLDDPILQEPAAPRNTPPSPPPVEEDDRRKGHGPQRLHKRPPPRVQDKGARALAELNKAWRRKEEALRARHWAFVQAKNAVAELLLDSHAPTRRVLKALKEISIEQQAVQIYTTQHQPVEFEDGASQDNVIIPKPEDVSTSPSQRVVAKRYGGAAGNAPPGVWIGAITLGQFAKFQADRLVAGNKQLRVEWPKSVVAVLRNHLFRVQRRNYNSPDEDLDDPGKSPSPRLKCALSEVNMSRLLERIAQMMASDLAHIARIAMDTVVVTFSRFFAGQDTALALSHGSWDDYPNEASKLPNLPPTTRSASTPPFHIQLILLSRSQMTRARAEQLLSERTANESAENAEPDQAEGKSPKRERRKSSRRRKSNKASEEAEIPEIDAEAVPPTDEVDEPSEAPQMQFEPPLSNFHEQVMQSFEDVVEIFLGVPRIDHIVLNDVTLDKPLQLAIEQCYVDERRAQLHAAVLRGFGAPNSLLNRMRSTYESLVDQHCRREAYGREFAEGHPGLVEYEKEIRGHVDRAERIETSLPHTVYLGLFAIDTTPIKKSLSTMSLQLATGLLECLWHEVQGDRVEIVDAFEQAMARLKEVPQSPEEWNDLSKYVMRIPGIVAQLSEAISQMMAKYDLLADFQFDVSNQESRDKWAVVSFPKQILSKAEKTQSILDQAEADFKGLLARQKDDLEQRVQRVRAETTKCDAFEDVSGASQDLNFVQGLQTDLLDARTLAMKYQGHEILYGKAPTDYSHIDEALNQLEPHVRLWKTIADWSSCYNEWMFGPFNKLDPKAVQAQIDGALTTIGELDPLMAGKIHPLKAMEIAREQIKAFVVHMPLIRALRNPGMRERHWISLRNATGTALRAEYELTLVNVVDQHNLTPHLETVEKISRLASEEYKVESTLEKMQQAWSTVIFRTEVFMDTGARIVIRPDDALQLVEDQIVEIHSIAASPYVEPHVERIQLWERKLTRISDVVDVWLKCQRGWMHFVPIFASNDMLQQLPQEGRRFSSIDRTWREVMQMTMKSPKVIVATSTPKLLDSLREMNKQLNAVSKGIVGFLNNRRAAFPRLYYLANEELLSILSLSDPRAMRPHLPKLFPGIASLSFDSGAEPLVTKITGAAGEVLPLINPVRATQQAEQWLTGLESAMRESIRSAIRAAAAAAEWRKVTVTPYANTAEATALNSPATSQSSMHSPATTPSSSSTSMHGLGALYKSRDVGTARKRLLLDWPGQIAMVVQNARLTAEVEEVIEVNAPSGNGFALNIKRDPRALRSVLQRIQERIADCAAIIMNEVAAPIGSSFQEKKSSSHAPSHETPISRVHALHKSQSSASMMARKEAERTGKPVAVTIDTKALEKSAALQDGRPRPYSLRGAQALLAQLIHFRDVVRDISHQGLGSYSGPKSSLHEVDDRTAVAASPRRAMRKSKSHSRLPSSAVLALLSERDKEGHGESSATTRPEKAEAEKAAPKAPPKDEEVGAGTTGGRVFGFETDDELGDDDPWANAALAATKESFLWASQLRYYLVSETGDRASKQKAGSAVKVCQMEASLDYGDEFLGTPQPLIWTKQTKRVFMGMTEALHSGTSPLLVGPAQSGRSTMAAALADALGRACILFSCTPDLDPTALGKLFRGACGSGSVFVLDNADRLTASTLSVIAKYIAVVQHALQKGKTTCMLDDKSECPLHWNTAFAVIAHVYSQGRPPSHRQHSGPMSHSAGALSLVETSMGPQPLPANLAVLLRPVAMSRPDPTQLLETMIKLNGLADPLKFSQYPRQQRRSHRHSATPVRGRPQQSSQVHFAGVDPQGSSSSLAVAGSMSSSRKLSLMPAGHIRNAIQSAGSITQLTPVASPIEAPATILSRKLAWVIRMLKLQLNVDIGVVAILQAVRTAGRAYMRHAEALANKRSNDVSVEGTESWSVEAVLTRTLHALIAPRADLACGVAKIGPWLPQWCRVVAKLVTQSRLGQVLDLQNSIQAKRIKDAPSMNAGEGDGQMAGGEAAMSASGTSPKATKVMTLPPRGVLVRAAVRQYMDHQCNATGPSIASVPGSRPTSAAEQPADAPSALRELYFLVVAYSQPLPDPELERIVDAAMRIFSAVDVLRPCIVVGPPGCGKTLARTALAAALSNLAKMMHPTSADSDDAEASKTPDTQKASSPDVPIQSILQVAPVIMETVFPGAVGYGRTFGRMVDADAEVWRDGLIPSIIRSAGNELDRFADEQAAEKSSSKPNGLHSSAPRHQRWLVLDGPAAPYCSPAQRALGLGPASSMATVNIYSSGGGPWLDSLIPVLDSQNYNADQAGLEDPSASQASKELGTSALASTWAPRLCLPNSERLIVPKTMRVIIETDSMVTISPAALTRLAVVPMNRLAWPESDSWGTAPSADESLPTTSLDTGASQDNTAEGPTAPAWEYWPLHLREVVSRWVLDKKEREWLPTVALDRISTLIGDGLPKCTYAVRKSSCNFSLPSIYDSPYDALKYVLDLIDGLCLEMVSDSGAARPFSAVPRESGDAVRPSSSRGATPTFGKDPTVIIRAEIVFVQALAWALGGALSPELCQVIDDCLRTLIPVLNVKDCLPPRGQGTIFDYAYDTATGLWRSWDTVAQSVVANEAVAASARAATQAAERAKQPKRPGDFSTAVGHSPVPPAQLGVPDAKPFYDWFVPTGESESRAWLLKLLALKGRPAVLVGNRTSGTTSTVAYCLRHKLPNKGAPQAPVSSIRKNDGKGPSRASRAKFSTASFCVATGTPASRLQQFLEGKVDRRRKGTYAPPQNAQLIIFADDLFAGTGTAASALAGRGTTTKNPDEDVLAQDPNLCWCEADLGVDVKHSKNVRVAPRISTGCGGGAGTGVGIGASAGGSAPAGKYLAPGHPLELCRQLIDQGGWYNNTLNFNRLLNITLFATSRSGAQPHRCPHRRAARLFTDVLLPPMSDKKIEHIYDTIFASHLTTEAVFSEEGSRGMNAQGRTLSTVIAHATVELLNWVRDEIPVDVLDYRRAHCLVSMHDISKIYQGLLLARGATLGPSEENASRLWIHEASTVFMGRFGAPEDRYRIQERIYAIAREELGYSAPSALSDPLYCTFSTSAGSYEDPGGAAIASRRLRAHLQDVNKQRTLPLALPTTIHAVRHVARLNRVLSTPGGHAVVLGRGGGDADSIVRLAAAFGRFHVVSPGDEVVAPAAESVTSSAEVAPDVVGDSEPAGDTMAASQSAPQSHTKVHRPWRAALRKATMMAGVEGRSTVLILGDSDLMDACGLMALAQQAGAFHMQASTLMNRSDHSGAGAIGLSRQQPATGVPSVASIKRHASATASSDDDLGQFLFEEVDDDYMTAEEGGGNQGAGAGSMMMLGGALSMSSPNLNDLTNVMMVGDCPSLWSHDDLQRIINVLRPLARGSSARPSSSTARRRGGTRSGKPPIAPDDAHTEDVGSASSVAPSDITAQVFDFFSERVKKNLHIVFTLGQRGDITSGSFGRCLRVCPEISAHATVAWCDAPTSGDLEALAKNRLSRADVGAPEMLPRVAKACVQLHEAAVTLALRTTAAMGATGGGLGPERSYQVRPVDTDYPAEAKENDAPNPDMAKMLDQMLPQIRGVSRTPILSAIAPRHYAVEDSEAPPLPSGWESSRPQLGTRVVIPTVCFTEFLDLFRKWVEAWRMRETVRGSAMETAHDHVARIRGIRDDSRLELRELQPKLKLAMANAEEIMVLVAKQRFQADELRADLDQEAAQAAAKSREATTIADDIQNTLSIAEKEIDHQCTLLRGVTKKDLKAERANPNPSARAVLSMEAVCLLRGIKPRKGDIWAEARAMLAEKDFIKPLLHMDKMSMSAVVADRLASICQSPDYRVDAPPTSKNKEKASRIICGWVRALDQYRVARLEVMPKRTELQNAQEQLIAKQTILDELHGHLADINDEIQKHTLRHRKAMERKAELAQAANDCEKRMDRVTALLRNVREVAAIWTKSLQMQMAEFEAISAHALLAAASVVYLGAFTGDQRRALQSMWRKILVDLQIPGAESKVVRPLPLPPAAYRSLHREDSTLSQSSRPDSATSSHRSGSRIGTVLPTQTVDGGDGDGGPATNVSGQLVIPLSEAPSIFGDTVLSDVFVPDRQEVLSWLAKGHPPDADSIHTSIIIKHARRWVVLAEFSQLKPTYGVTERPTGAAIGERPQSSVGGRSDVPGAAPATGPKTSLATGLAPPAGDSAALRRLRCIVDNADTRLIKLDPDDANFEERLETCVTEGFEALMITHGTFSFPAVADAILGRHTVTERDGQTHVRLGDRMIKWHPNFRLYIILQDAQSDTIPEEVYMKYTLVNITVPESPAAVQDTVLNAIVSREKPQLHDAMISSRKICSELRSRLSTMDDRMIDALANIPEEKVIHVADDDAFPQKIADLRRHQVTQIGKLEDANARLITTSEGVSAYIPLACRAAALHQATLDAATSFAPACRYSLQSLINITTQTLNLAPLSEHTARRVAYLIADVTKQFVAVVLRGMEERLRPLFALLCCARLMQSGSASVPLPKFLPLPVPGPDALAPGPIAAVWDQSLSQKRAIEPDMARPGTPRRPGTPGRPSTPGRPTTPGRLSSAASSRSSQAAGPARSPSPVRRGGSLASLSADEAGASLSPYATQSEEMWPRPFTATDAEVAYLLGGRRFYGSSEHKDEIRRPSWLDPIMWSDIVALSHLPGGAFLGLDESIATDPVSWKPMLGTRDGTASASVPHFSSNPHRLDVFRDTALLASGALAATASTPLALALSMAKVGPYGPHCRRIYPMKALIDAQVAQGGSGRPGSSRPGSGRMSRSSRPESPVRSGYVEGERLAGPDSEKHWVYAWGGAGGLSLPGQWARRPLTPFQALLLFSVVRPERLPPIADGIIRDVLGPYATLTGELGGLCPEHGALGDSATAAQTPAAPPQRGAPPQAGGPGAGVAAGMSSGSSPAAPDDLRDLAAALKESTPVQPIIVLTPVGLNAHAAILALAESQGLGGGAKRVVHCPMGRRQEQNALFEMEEAIDRGKWVIIENPHLNPNPQWMSMLRRAIASIPPTRVHTDFRVWLVCPHDAATAGAGGGIRGSGPNASVSGGQASQLPLDILRRGMKVVLQVPGTIRSFVIRSLLLHRAQVDSISLGAGAAQSSASRPGSSALSRQTSTLSLNAVKSSLPYRQLSCALFMAIGALNERRKYGRLGFQETPVWTENDAQLALAACAHTAKIAEALASVSAQSSAVAVPPPATSTPGVAEVTLSSSISEDEDPSIDKATVSLSTSASQSGDGSGTGINPALAMQLGTLARNAPSAAQMQHAITYRLARRIATIYTLRLSSPRDKLVVEDTIRRFMLRPELLTGEAPPPPALIRSMTTTGSGAGALAVVGVGFGLGVAVTATRAAHAGLLSRSTTPASEVAIDMVSIARLGKSTKAGLALIGKTSGAGSGGSVGVSTSAMTLMGKLRRERSKGRIPPLSGKEALPPLAPGAHKSKSSTTLEQSSGEPGIPLQASVSAPALEHRCEVQQTKQAEWEASQDCELGTMVPGLELSSLETTFYPLPTASGSARALAVFAKDQLPRFDDARLLLGMSPVALAIQALWSGNEFVDNLRGVLDRRTTIAVPSVSESSDRSQPSPTGFEYIVGMLDAVSNVITLELLQRLCNRLIIDPTDDIGHPERVDTRSHPWWAYAQLEVHCARALVGRVRLDISALKQAVKGDIPTLTRAHEAMLMDLRMGRAPEAWRAMDRPFAVLQSHSHAAALPGTATDRSVHNTSSSWDSESALGWAHDLKRRCNEAVRIRDVVEAELLKQYAKGHVQSDRQVPTIPTIALSMDSTETLTKVPSFATTAPGADSMVITPSLNVSLCLGDIQRPETLLNAVISAAANAWDVLAQCIRVKLEPIPPSGEYISPHSTPECMMIFEGLWLQGGAQLQWMEDTTTPTASQDNSETDLTEDVLSDAVPGTGRYVLTRAPPGILASPLPPMMVVARPNWITDKESPEPFCYECPLYVFRQAGPLSCAPSLTAARMGGDLNEQLVLGDPLPIPDNEEATYEFPEGGIGSGSQGPDDHNVESLLMTGGGNALFLHVSLPTSLAPVYWARRGVHVVAARR